MNVKMFVSENNKFKLKKNLFKKTKVVNLSLTDYFICLEKGSVARLLHTHS